MIDENGNRIQLGDTLRSRFGYDVVVVEWPDCEGWVGKLVCEPNDPCADIPYCLNDGKGHIRIQSGGRDV